MSSVEVPRWAPTFANNRTSRVELGRRVDVEANDEAYYLLREKP
jgi:hypothetical protein